MSGDHVYVSAAYESTSARRAIQLARTFRIALALLVVAGAFLLPRTITWRQEAIAAAGLAAYAAIGLADDRLLGLPASAARRWLGASLTMLAGLALCAYGLPAQSRARRILAWLTFAMSIILVAGLPELRHQTPTMLAAAAIAAFAGVIGARLLARGLFAAGSGGSLGAPAAALCAILVALFQREAIGAWGMAATAGAVAGGIALRRRLGVVPRIALWWRGTVLTTAILGFAIATLLTSRVGWVHAVIAIERTSGSVLWTREGFVTPRTPVHRANSQATPTPVVFRDGVVAYFGEPGMMAVDRTGRLLWTNRRVPFKSMYGAGASPVSGGASVIVSSFTQDGPYLASFDPATGRERWRTTRAAVHPEFGDSRTPLVMTVNGRRTVVVWGMDNLAGHDVETGLELWRYAHDANHRMGSMVASLVGNGDLIVLPLENGAIALRASKLASGGDPVAWTSRGGGSALATPVLYEDRIYAVSAAGVATCTDGRTGELRWRARLSGEFGSSPVAVAGHVYFTNNEGRTTVVGAADEFRIVAENDIGEPVSATIAPVDGALYIRGADHVFRVGS